MKKSASKSKTSSKKITGFTVVISSPSGGGKTTIVDRLLRRHPDWLRSISATTRAPRDGEVPEKDYFFVSSSTFRRMQEHGEFLEHAKVVDHHYGTPKRFVVEQCAEGRVMILTLDIQGMKSLQKALKDEIPLLTIFILPPSLKELRKRLEGRKTESAEMIEKRLNLAAEEIKAAGLYDAAVVNRDLEHTVLEIEKIIEHFQKTRRHQLTNWC